MKCKKRTQSNQVCSSIMFNGPKGYVCPCETSHSDAQAYQVTMSTTVHLTPTALSKTRSMLEQLWPKQSWSNDSDVVTWIVKEHIYGGDYTDVVDEVKVSVSGTTEVALEQVRRILA